MFHARINKHQLISLRIEWIVLVFKRFAVQKNQLALLSENGSELIHDAAVDSTVIMFSGLTDLSKLEFIYLIAIQFVYGKCERAFQSCGRRKAGSERNITCENGIEALNFPATLNRLPADAKYVASPLLLRLVFLIHAEFDIFIIV